MTFLWWKLKVFFHLYSLSSSSLCMSLRETGEDITGRRSEPVVRWHLFISSVSVVPAKKQEYSQKIKSLCPQQASLQHLWVAVHPSHLSCSFHYHSFTRRPWKWQFLKRNQKNEVKDWRVETIWRGFVVQLVSLGRVSQWQVNQNYK